MKFWKYHGLGNDFVVVENPELDIPDDPDFVRRICDRRTGVGADGILYINPDEEADAFMRVLNSDGSEAEMCGNGIRCVAKHLYDMSLAPTERMRINTMGGMKEIVVQVDDGVAVGATVDMGAPRLDRPDIPMTGDGRFIDGTLEVEGRKVTGTAVSMGNPHLIIFDPLSDDEIRELGPLLERHPLFPRRTNVEFVRKEGDVLTVSVYERGAGWTQACGTGACATAVAAGLKGLAPLGRDVRVRLPGGELKINVAEDLSSVRMTGPAARVFRGELEDDAHDI
ncbi:MAG: diaminopimelate epimerase [Methanomassiliicoccaceae archaeon]|jgi:diaminopimelate epimerase|nr:diaminopimelate epimerase [Euryarchaeota archaeon]HOQ26694.1 diaminopimelate epimerase [Methanomassiliicoccaceae archaeon]HQA20470.1 diaminopimelate epimerase [Methanomassiliicoccaceae archaeon]